MPDTNRILVIRLSALGDVVRCLGVMAAIRQHHPHAHITWMTTKPFAPLLDGSHYADAVWTIQRWRWWQVGAWLGFIRTLKHFDLVYDLQRNDRTAFMRSLAPSRLRQRWLGAHTTGEGALDARDIARFAMPPMAWMGQETSLAIPPSPYALLVPGSAPQHPAKRWPVEHYIALAQRAVAHGIIPVALGTQAERPILDALKANVPQLIDLGGKTSFGDIAALARGAVAAVGNDTGPMHIIAVAGCPCVSLFSGTTNPAQSAPVGTVAVLRAEHIADIAVDAVWENFQTIRRVPATA